MLKNLQEIMDGDATHAAVHLWSDQFLDAEAAAIRSRGQRDPRYREELDGLLGIIAAMEGLEGDSAIQELIREPRRLLRQRRVKRRLTLGIAAGFLAAIGVVLAVLSPSTEESQLQKYYTRTGEQQAIQLDDGSGVTLNTGSQLLVEYSGSARRILLKRGEAYFEVAEDSERPFTVDLGTHAVTALGTAFNVRKDPERYQVAVLEGAVALHAVTDELPVSLPSVSIRGPGPRRVEAGWVAEFKVSSHELTAFQPESMERYRDWRGGMLSFSYEPLSQVVQELNRYSRKKILIEDASVMELSVVSAIRITDIDAALYGLEQVLPIKVTRYYDRIVITASGENEQHDP